MLIDTTLQTFILFKRERSFDRSWREEKSGRGIEKDEEEVEDGGEGDGEEEGELRRKTKQREQELMEDEKFQEIVIWTFNWLSVALRY